MGYSKKKIIFPLDVYFKKTYKKKNKLQHTYKKTKLYVNKFSKKRGGGKDDNDNNDMPPLLNPDTNTIINHANPATSATSNTTYITTSKPATPSDIPIDNITLDSLPSNQYIDITDSNIKKQCIEQLNSINDEKKNKIFFCGQKRKAITISGINPVDSCMEELLYYKDTWIFSSPDNKTKILYEFIKKAELPQDSFIFIEENDPLFIYKYDEEKYKTSKCPNNKYTNMITYVEEHKNDPEIIKFIPFVFNKDKNYENYLFKNKDGDYFIITSNNITNINGVLVIGKDQQKSSLIDMSYISLVSIDDLTDTSDLKILKQVELILNEFDIITDTYKFVNDTNNISDTHNYETYINNLKQSVETKKIKIQNISNSNSLTPLNSQNASAIENNKNAYEQAIENNNNNNQEMQPVNYAPLFNSNNKLTVKINENTNNTPQYVNVKDLIEQNKEEMNNPPENINDYINANIGILKYNEASNKNSKNTTNKYDKIRAYQKTYKVRKFFKKKNNPPPPPLLPAPQHTLKKRKNKTYIIEKIINFLANKTNKNSSKKPFSIYPPKPTQQ